MEVELATRFVDARDARLFHVVSDEAVGVGASEEHGLVQRGLLLGHGPKAFHDFGMQRHDGLVAVLGRLGAHDEAGPFAVELHIRPFQLPKFADTQARVSRRQVKEPPIRVRLNEPFEFLVGEGAAFLLLAAYIHLDDARERIRGDASLPEHPVEEHIERIEVFVHRARPNVVLVGAPCRVSVSRNIAHVTPAALLKLAADAHPQVRGVGLRAAQRPQVGEEVFEVFLKEFLRGVALELGRDDARAFHFALGDEFGELALGHDLVAGVDGDIGYGVFALKAETGAVEASGHGFTVLHAAWFVYKSFHLYRRKWRFS